MRHPSPGFEAGAQFELRGGARLHLSLGRWCLGASVGWS